MQAAQTDGSGNVGTSAAVTFSVKSSAPVVTLTAPVDGAALGSATPTIRGAAGTAAGDVNQVSVKLYAGSTATGTAVQTIAADVTGGAWSATAAALADGTYTVQATQSDTSGNVGTTAAATFTVDTKAPAVAVTQPTDGATVTSGTPTIRGTADGSSQVSVQLYAGSTATGTPVQTIAADVTGGAWSAAAAALDNGVYTVQATQTDAAGNTGSSAAVTFTVENSGPVVAVTAPAGWCVVGYGDAAGGGHR